MRIIGGSARGRTIRAPKGRTTRPTTDRVREALFSILGDLHELVVLDGYAGSGALGLEALSRGATRAYFIEIDRSALATIRENITTLNWEDRTRTLERPFVRALDLIEEDLDLVFLDPPYEQGLADASLEALADSGACRPDALVVLERSVREEPIRHWAFDFDEDRVYGDTILSFYYRNRHSEPPESMSYDVGKKETFES